MSQLYINTVQNVRIEQIPASVAERIVAHIIDYLLFGGYSLIFLLGVGNIVHFNIAYMIVASLPMVFYDLFCEITLDGQTVGKMVMNIKVVKDDGTEPKLSDYFIRWIFRVIDTISTLGAVATLTTIFNGQGKRLGDIVAATRMIRIKKEIGSDTLIQPISANYSPTFHEAINLTDKDIQVIKEVLNFALDNPSVIEARAMLAKTKAAIEKKLQIKSESYPYNFLELIVKDYTYLNLNN